MSDIVTSLIEKIKPFSHRPICIAYSGGVDSQVLLHALVQIKQTTFPTLKLSVCHVNHGLSDNAQQWQTFAEQTCESLSIPFTCHQVSLKKLPRQSLEAIAREARYQAISESCKENAVIVTGHHLHDQFETFLLALKRGSGVQGLGAMQEVIALDFKEQLLLRPLLGHSRQDIETFAERYQLPWIEDESNQDHMFDRNFIRHEISPKLIKRWPSFLTTVARSAALCQESQQILQEVAKADTAQCLSANNRLSVTSMKALSHARQKQVIRYMLQQHNAKMPSQSQLEQAIAQLAQQELSLLAVKLGDKWLRHFKGELYITSELADVSDWHHCISLTDIPLNLSLPDNLGSLMLTQETRIEKENCQRLSLPKDANLRIQFRHDNPKVLPDYRQERRVLKKVWQELSVPTWQRSRIPLVYVNNELVAAAGYFVCKPFLPTLDQQTYVLHWCATPGSG